MDDREDGITVTHHTNRGTLDEIFTARVPTLEWVLARMPHAIVERVIEKMADAITAAYIDRVTPEVLKAVTPEAIATLTMAKMSASIAKEVNHLAHVEANKPPVKVDASHHSTSLFSIFG